MCLCSVALSIWTSGMRRCRGAIRWRNSGRWTGSGQLVQDRGAGHEGAGLYSKSVTLGEHVISLRVFAHATTDFIAGLLRRSTKGSGIATYVQWKKLLPKRRLTRHARVTSCVNTRPAMTLREIRLEPRHLLIGQPVQIAHIQSPCGA